MKIMDRYMRKKLIAKMLVFLMSLTMMVNGMPLNVFAEGAESVSPSQNEVSADMETEESAAESGAVNTGPDAEAENAEEAEAKGAEGASAGADETGDADSRSQEEEPEAPEAAPEASAEVKEEE